MKRYLLPSLLILSYFAAAQGPVTTANTCFDNKAYQCAADNYKKAIADKAYEEKDYSTILYRIGYSLGEVNQKEEAVTYLNDAVSKGANFGAAYWALGGNYYGLKKYQLAADNYSLAISKYPTDKESLKTLYYWKGRCLLEIDKYADALSAFKYAMAIDSTNENYYVYAADAAYSSGQYSDAVQYYQTSIQLVNSDKTIMAARYYWLGESLFKLKRYDEAIEAYKRAIDNNPPYKNAVWAIAESYFNTEKWQDAIKMYTSTLLQYKGDTSTTKKLYYYRGRSYVKVKDFSSAMADFDAALKIDRQYRSVLWQVAYVSYLQKKYREAIPAFDIAIDAFKNSTADLDDLTYYRGYCYLQIKDTAKARADFLKSIGYNASLADPNYYLGHLSFADKKYYDAKTYYTKALPAYQTDSVDLSLAYFRRGYSNFTMGSSYYASAKSDFLKSVLYDAENKAAHRYLGDVYYQESNFGMAEMELDKCIRLYASSKDSLPVLYKYRGMVRSQQIKYKEALADYEQSDKLKKFDDPEMIKVMGQLAFETKDYNKTVGFFNRLQPLYKPEQKNELLFVYYARGRAELELKKKAPAIADLSKALELAPGNTEIDGYLTKAKAL
jgi:tetratricopeptide (TPR) repeat protein